MARKRLAKNSPGTATTWGSDDWDRINEYLTDFDQTALDPVSIKTNTSYWDNRLRVWNPAKTKSYRIRGLAIVNDYDLTLPLLSSNDEIVGLLATQTLQNKQINVNNNTLKHGTTNAIGDLLVGTGTKYDRFAMGSTGGYVLAIKNDLTGLEWVAAPGGGGGGTITTASNVGTGGVGMFKQVSGTGLQFKKLNVASGGLITVTDDTANSEVDLKIIAGTDGQFLKTVGTTPTWTTMSGAALVMPDGSSYSGSRWGAYQGGAGAYGGDGMFGGLEHSGIMDYDIGTSGTRTAYRTLAVDGDIAGHRTLGRCTRRSQNPKLKMRVANNPSTERGWSGFHSDVTYPGGANPLVNKHGVMVGFDESATNFTIKWNNGGASPQSSATAVAKDTNYHTIEIWLVDSSASVSVWFDGTLIVNANTTQVPATGQSLGYQTFAESVGGTVVDMRVEWSMLTF